MVTENRSMVVLGLGCGKEQEERIIKVNEKTWGTLINMFTILNVMMFFTCQNLMKSHT